MKILHTADWHLGLVTEGHSRKDEQEKILNELCLIADSKNIDIVLICGDIFAAANMPAHADQMAADVLLRLSNEGKRAVVAIAGNNDATERFTTIKKFGALCNIFLLNDLGTDFIDKDKEGQAGAPHVIDSGRGYIVFEKNGEKACIAFMPYPSNLADSERTKDGETLEAKTKRLFELGAGAFRSDFFNIAAAHLFVPNGKYDKDFYYEFSKNVLPKGANYTALGHVHETVELPGNVVYSGSLTQVFETESYPKYVVVLNTEKGKLISKEFVRLKEPKRLVAVTGETYKEVREKLGKLENCLAKVKIKQSTITADEILAIKTEFPFVISFVLIPKTKKAQLNIATKQISDAQLLKKFFEATYTKWPSKELEKLFVETLQGGGKQDETH